ncbi:uncharacterized protein LOC119603585 [Lucilia sericata]|uniref:uncharacterized protein LOC119603585 n=1 Tax=Lucilia sericata TaxID=13632 RepID=UPI0018A81CB8|nr:uncharacterized protein LOC119603585 [Lucilia sericata]
MEFGKYNPLSLDFHILPERLRNLKGYKLRTIADHIEPRAMEYYNENNETKLNGYIGRFVKTISEILNASLYFPLKVPPDVMLDYRDIMGYVSNYSLDIPVSSLSLFEFDDQHDFSYPFEMGKWCILLPMEKPLDFKEVFLIILHSQIMFITMILITIFTMVFYLAGSKNHQCGGHRWPEIIINDKAIRGVLGQGFVISKDKTYALKLIHLMLLLSGLTISSIFGSYLLSFNTQPPLEPEIDSYQNLAKSSLKLAITKTEIDYLHNITNGSLVYLYKKFHTFANFVEYSRFRDTFDRRFAYPTTTSKMLYYSGLESFYGTKFFRYSSKMCPNTMMLFQFPLGPNSYFLTRINEIIMNTMQSGLLEYWMSKSYIDAVTAGKVIHINITYPTLVSPLYLHDLYWIWLYFIIAITAAIVVFIMELLIHKKFGKY